MRLHFCKDCYAVQVTGIAGSSEAAENRQVRLSRTSIIPKRRVDNSSGIERARARVAHDIAVSCVSALINEPAGSVSVTHQVK